MENLCNETVCEEWPPKKGCSQGCVKSEYRKETIEEMKARIYPERKAAVCKAVECYRDRLLHLTDHADENGGDTVTIPVGMAYALVDVCNFVERLDSYGK